MPNWMKIFVACLVVIRTTSAQVPISSDVVYYTTPANCDAEPYGIVYNYGTATTQINAALQSIANSGQTTIALPIFYSYDGGNTGTVIDLSISGGLQLLQTNLQNLLTYIAGVEGPNGTRAFSLVLLGMYPQGGSTAPTISPWYWDAAYGGWR